MRDSLLAFSQIESFSSSTFRVFSKIEISLSLMITVVSSAYNMQNNISDTLQMSLMYIMNNRGPRIDPWGIPHLIGWVDECASSKATYYDLSSR